jgi:hypothetical protein
MRNNRALHIKELFDYAVAHPAGFTRPEAQAALGWNRSLFTKIMRDLRLLLGGTDTINLVCDLQGRASEPHRYQLVGNIDDAREYIGRRLRDVESRVLTARNVVNSIARATDARTRDGRRARIIKRGLTRIVEDLADLDHGSPPLF